MPPRAPAAVAIAEHGGGPGAPLVLVHGLATTRMIWRRVVPRLATSRRVVTLDVPGFGASPPAGPGFDLTEVAGVLAEALRRFAPYDLVGHSLGGALALTLAADHHEDVERVVLVAPAGLRPMDERLARFFGFGAAMAIPLRRQGAGLADTAWGRALLMSPGTADPGSVPPAEVRAMLEASRGSTRIAEALAAAASADLRERLRTMPVPLGAVWGDGDRIIPPGGVDTVIGLRPAAPVRTVERTGHIPMMERPEAFLDALHAVLEELSHPGNTARTASA